MSEFIIIGSYGRHATIPIDMKKFGFLSDDVQSRIHRLALKKPPALTKDELKVICQCYLNETQSCQ
jgi:hypothetical protein